MANHRSAIKRHRQSLKARMRNKAVKTRVKNVSKSVRTAIEENDKQKAAEALKAATKALDKAASKKVIHKKTAARRISRLARAVNSQA
ncbi:MAG: 30S ribosomal protein S20 [Desulfovibrionales bacterium]